MAITAYDLTDGQDPMTHAEIDYLMELAGGLPESPLIVNIGADIGVSTTAFLTARPGVTIFSLDLLECPQEKENVEQAGLDPDRVIRLLGRSQEIGLHFPYRCDMLYVDGGHSYDAVKRDIEAWVPKVQPGGIIAFHDYMEDPPPNNPSEAKPAVDEGMVGYEQIGRVDRVIVFRQKGAE